MRLTKLGEPDKRSGCHPEISLRMKEVWKLRNGQVRVRQQAIGRITRDRITGLRIAIRLIVDEHNKLVEQFGRLNSGLVSKPTRINLVYG